MPLEGVKTRRNLQISRNVVWIWCHRRAYQIPTLLMLKVLGQIEKQRSGCYITPTFPSWMFSFYENRLCNLYFLYSYKFCHLINLWSTVPQVPVLTKRQLGKRITIADLSKMERILAQLCLPVLGKYGSCCHIRWTDSKFYMKNPR
jgi:hypothetical protein